MWFLCIHWCCVGPEFDTMADEGEKRFAIVLKSKGMCLEGPLAKKAALLFTESYHIWVRGGGIFCPSLGTLSLEPSTDLCVGRCSGLVRELATSVRKLLQMVHLISDRTPTKHHPRVWGPHWAKMLSSPPVQCHHVFCKIKSLTISVGPWIHLNATSLRSCFIQFANVKKIKLILVATLQVHPNSVTSIAHSIF